MYTIVGLGNPGAEYEATRHNAGRIIARLLTEEGDVRLKEQKKPASWVGTGEALGERVRLILPDTFMNKSGSAITPYVKSVSAAKKLIILYDDIDLPLGAVRVGFGSSSGGHNGIKSIERAVKTRNYIKIRIGVARHGKKKGSVVAKKPDGDDATVDYLLGKFTKTEMEKLTGPVKERVFLALTTIFETGSPEMGMNAVNGLPVL